MEGRKVGHFTIKEQLGAGGMGVVYLATDMKLGRDVAIKALPDKFASDPERLSRFEREARMLASLNHPNIASIHGVEDADGARYLVLEFVPGETVAERLKRGPLEIPEAIMVCRQIAEALEAAHDKGIIHRDLKPANVKITPEKKVKVLDFGLAKAFQAGPLGSDSSQLPTVTIEDATAGKILGTAAYMSPEQARGMTVDKRTDIWAFGCLLYEMLAGTRAFGGESATDSMAAVLTQEPDWNALPDSTPSHLRTLLRRCLQKDPQKRMRDPGDVRLELEDPPPAQAVGIAPSRVKPLLVYAACLMVGALLTGAIAWTLGLKANSPHRVTRFTITLPPGEILSPQSQSSIALSPDGTKLAYVVNRSGRTQIYWRSFDRIESRPLAGTDNAIAPVFSPDGQWVAFLQAMRWKRAALSGGAAVTICEAPLGSYQAAAWGADDNLLFGVYPAGVLQVPASGGTPRALFASESSKGERAYWHPYLLPGGKGVLFSIRTPEMDSYDDGPIAVQPLPSGERKILVEGGYRPSYLPSGHLVYARAGQLLAVRLNLARLSIDGPPVPVLDNVLMNHANGATHYSVSSDGSLAYVPGGAIAIGRQLVWVDRQGHAETLPVPLRRYLHPRISPDGRRLAVEIEGANHDFWTYEPERGVMTKMSDNGHSHWPLWTPDGSKLTFRSWRTGTMTMWWMPADRSGPEERLTTTGASQSAASWSPDGRVVAFTQISPETGGDVYVLEMDTDRKPRPFVQTRFNEGSPRFSPDGRYIAYSSNESGRNEIYVTPFPGPGARIQISSEGGTDAVWKPKGSELYYRDGDKMMVLDIATYPAFHAGKPRLLWEGQYNHGMNSICGPPGPGSSNYDVTADGGRFLMIREGEHDLPATEIQVVLNWSEELKRLDQDKK